MFVGSACVLSAYLSSSWRAAVGAKRVRPLRAQAIREKCAELEKKFGGGGGAAAAAAGGSGRGSEPLGPPAGGSGANAFPVSSGREHRSGGGPQEEGEFRCAGAGSFLCEQYVKGNGHQGPCTKERAGSRAAWAGGWLAG